MRASERVKEISSGKSPCQVVYQPQTLYHGIGRNLFTTQNDPYQFSKQRLGVISHAETHAIERANRKTTPRSQRSWKESDPHRLSIITLDRGIPGYSGFIPGQISENLYKLGPRNIASLSNIITRNYLLFYVNISAMPTNP